MSLGTDLRERRIAKGLGPVQAAAEMGVTYRTLKRAENGGRIHTASARKIADFYELDEVEALALIDDLTEAAA